MAAKTAALADPEDYFATTRMSFGDHIEELRVRLFKALKGLVFFLTIGFVLDGVGFLLERPNIGIGRPMFTLLTKPVEEMVRDYYYRQVLLATPKLPVVQHVAAGDLQRIREKLAAAGDRREALTEDERRKVLAAENLDRIEQKLRDNDNHIAALTEDERQTLLAKVEAMPVHVRRAALEKAVGTLPNGPDEYEVEVLVSPAYFSYFGSKGEALLQTRKYLTTLSVQEPFLVYMKVSLLCGLVLGSPYIFYQIWAFVAAGLYPHEKKYVHVYMPFSIGLFLAGCVLCQFMVVPSAVQSLLGLNSFLGTDPDIRLNEWLSFALILPLVFGVSFQTPLIMLFLNRIGIFSYQDYITYWRGAAFSLMVGAILILPTPDVLTMLYLYVPMFLLYLLGIGLCKWFPKDTAEDTADESSQVAV
jgi:sec-independent protein translocase protein TatC